MAGDVNLVVTWVLTLFLLGISSFPLTFFWLKDLTAGTIYVVSKVVGYLSVSLLVWIFTQLEVFELEISLWIGIGLLLVTNGITAWKLRSDLCLPVKIEWKSFLHWEILFTCFMLFWVLVRGFSPEIVGLEKFMDLGLVNTILRSESLPPADQWLAGSSVIYYYFGHLETAVLTQLTGIPSSVTYNLMLGTLFSLSTCLAALVGINLLTVYQKKVTHWQVITVGGLTALLTIWRGNLHLGGYYLNTVLQVSWLPDTDIPYAFADATRSIDQVIHEFPMYSFVVSDLHAHVLNLPHVLLLLLGILLLWKRRTLDLQALLPLGTLLAVSWLTSPWDTVIYLPLILMMCGAIAWKTGNLLQFKLLKHSSTLLISLLVVMLINQQESRHFYGIGWFPQTSDVSKFLLVWGFEMLLSYGFWKLFLKEKNKGRRLQLWLLGIMNIYGWILVMVPELLYIKLTPDEFPITDPRSNTMFKFTYQAWLLLSITGGYALFIWRRKLLNEGKLAHISRWWLGAVAISLVVVCIYPIIALTSYYQHFQNYKGLDGEYWLAEQYPEDFQVIQWLTNLQGQPVIVEGVGNSFSEFGRVSVYTGLPTVVNWPEHEWLWRGGNPQPIVDRVEDVDRFYTTTNVPVAQDFLKTYKVDYVYFGSLEMQKYGNTIETVMSELGSEVFRADDSVVYKVKEQ